MLNKVLIVEDSPLQAKMYRTVFSGDHVCQLVFANNGIEALDKLTLEEGIDLIILDINMPRMDGISFLRAMRNGGFQRIPVIVISTEGKDQDIRIALEEGAKAYMKKPWTPDQVRDIVNRLVNQ